MWSMFPHSHRLSPMSIVKNYIEIKVEGKSTGYQRPLTFTFLNYHDIVRRDNNYIIGLSNACAIQNINVKTVRVYYYTLCLLYLLY